MSARARRGPSPLGTGAVAALLACALAAGCAPPDGGEGAALADSATFVVRLGTDTTSVERFAHRGDEMEIVSVSRTPGTVVREAVLEFGDDGAPERFRVEERAPGEGGPPDERTTVTFSGDSATVETVSEGETETRRLASRPGAFPWDLSFLSLSEAIARRAVATGRDTVWILDDGPEPVAVRRPAPDSVVLETPGLGAWRARTDGAGRIASMDAGALGRSVERVGWLDIRALADGFAARDARGEGMGPLSPRDSVRATVDGAEILVAYGRPARRGRTVFGGLVPWDEVWRTGANQATRLVTDRDLEIGGTGVPAGDYSLFTIPGRESWTLIVNRETGQAGTQYDEARDLARIPMETMPLDSLVERFTISVDPAPEGGVLRMLWERTEARVPVLVAP